MTTNELTLFDFNGADIRVIDIDGTAWFVANDLFDALGYPKGSRTYQLKHMNDQQVSVSKIKTEAGPRNTKVVSKSGLYRLVLRSDRPDAADFQDWVTDVVLPAIENDGGYVRGEEKVETEEDLDALALRTMEMLRKKLTEKEQQLDVVSDMVTEVERTIHKIARQMEGVNSMAIKRDLMKAGYLYRRPERNSSYRVRRQYNHLFPERTTRVGSRVVSEITVTDAGMKKLAEMRAAGQLTILKGHAPH